jgi:hypothetical protein
MTDCRRPRFLGLQIPVENSVGSITSGFAGVWITALRTIQMFGA